MCHKYANHRTDLCLVVIMFLVSGGSMWSIYLHLSGLLHWHYVTEWLSQCQWSNPEGYGWHWLGSHHNKPEPKVNHMHISWNILCKAIMWKQGHSSLKILTIKHCKAPLFMEGLVGLLWGLKSVIFVLQLRLFWFCHYRVVRNHIITVPPCIMVQFVHINSMQMSPEGSLHTKKKSFQYTFTPKVRQSLSYPCNEGFTLNQGLNSVITWAIFSTVGHYT